MAIRGRRATFEERISACEALEAGISADTVAQVMGVSPVIGIHVVADLQAPGRGRAGDKADSWP